MYNNMLKLGQLNFLVSQSCAIPPLLLRRESFNLSTKREAQKRVDTGNKVKMAPDGTQ